MISPKHYFDFGYVDPNPEIELRILEELSKRPLTSHDLSYYLGLDIHTVLSWLKHLSSKHNIRKIDNCNVFYKLTKDLRLSRSRTLSRSPKPLPENIISLTRFKYIGNGHFKPISNFRKISRNLRGGL